jgi:hypothetical protein
MGRVKWGWVLVWAIVITLFVAFSWVYLQGPAGLRMG